MSRMRLLNVGGNSKSIPIPAIYKDFEHDLLDIDPVVQPDVLCDARELHNLKALSYDVVYCSHNLEHYYKHEVKRVLSGFKHILNCGGAAHIIVPNMKKVFQAVVNQDLDIDDVLYQSALGPILVSDVIYGYSKQIELSGVDFFAHKTGFTAKSLTSELLSAGFKYVKVGEDGFNLISLGYNGEANPELLKLF